MQMFVTMNSLLLSYPPPGRKAYVCEHVDENISNGKYYQESLIQEQWPLFLPALVATIEETEPHIRERGLQLLHTFLLKCTANTLSSTGIGRLFERLVFPITQYLPSLTPEHKSARLLRAAYQVLLQLARADPEPQSPARRRLLDKLMRDGIIASYFHASQYAIVTEILMHNAAEIVSLLGVLCVTHLRVRIACGSIG